MWRQPAIRAPLSGLVRPYFSRSAIRPGISFSANSISLRPHSARRLNSAGEQSRTLYGSLVATCDTGNSSLLNAERSESQTFIVVRGDEFSQAVMRLKRDLRRPEREGFAKTASQSLSS